MTRAHGSVGTLRAKFQKNLPPSAIVSRLVDRPGLRCAQRSTHVPSPVRKGLWRSFHVPPLAQLAVAAAKGCVELGWELQQRALINLFLLHLRPPRF